MHQRQQWRRTLRYCHLLPNCIDCSDYTTFTYTLAFGGDLHASEYSLLFSDDDDDDDEYIWCIDSML